MAWIESHQELGAHPKTRKLAMLLGISRPAAVGHLHYLWWWTNKYAPDGDLTRFEALDIAIAAEWDGDAEVFVVALIQAGFLDHDDEGLRVHDWPEYGEKHFRRRELNAARMRAARASQKEVRATHVQRTSTARAQNVLNNRTDKTDKTRQETPPTPPKGGKAASEPFRLFQEFCEITGTVEVDVPEATRNKQLGIAKRLLAKYGWDDVIGCVRWLASWRQAAWDLGTVSTEIDKWIMSGRKRDGKIGKNGSAETDPVLDSSKYKDGGHLRVRGRAA